MQSTKAYIYWLVMLQSFFVWNLTAQSCSLSFEGKETLCATEIITYELTEANSITDIEWIIEGDNIGNSTDVQVNWELYGDGEFELCVQGTTPCNCLLYTSPSPRDRTRSRMPSSA